MGEWHVRQRPRVRAYGVADTVSGGMAVDDRQQQKQRSAADNRFYPDPDHIWSFRTAPQAEYLLRPAAGSPAHYLVA